MQIVFTDPPPRPGVSQHPWALIAEQLKERPGEWALCLKAVTVAAHQINSGSNVSFRPKGAFRARTVQTGKKDEKGRPLVDLYIKYVGEDGAANDETGV
jgi:hypothetical protein